MEPIVVGDLGMEGQGEVRTLSDHDGITVALRDHHGSGADDSRRPDEDGAKRRRSDRRDRDVLLEGLDLASIPVAFDGQVECAEGQLIRSTVDDGPAEQDHPGAGGEARQPRGDSPAERLLEVEDAEKAAHRRRLAARHRQGIDALEVTGKPDRCDPAAAALEGGEVLSNVALEGQNADQRMCHMSSLPAV